MMNAVPTDEDLRLAVLMTCHNRRAKTLDCLESLESQTIAATVEVFLTDDGSTDGTAASVADRFPTTRIIRGTGDLYWAAGMHRSEQAALLGDYHAHLWLNDDVVLVADALARLVATWREVTVSGGVAAVVAGSVQGSDGSTTYGGVTRVGRCRPMRFVLAEPGEQPIAVDTAHGNVLLVPVELVHKIGGIDPRYRHAMADFDLGLRASAGGAPVFLAPGWFGMCDQNPTSGTFRDPNSPARERLTHLRSQKGLPPREWCRFTRRHAGFLWPIYFVAPYLRFGFSLVAPRHHGQSRH